MTNSQKIALWSVLGVAGGLLLLKLTERSTASSGSKPALAPPAYPPKGMYTPQGNQGPTSPEMNQLRPCLLPPEVSQLGATEACPADRSLGFPIDLAQREEYILDKVRRGNYFVSWVPVVSNANGHTATFFVSADALKVDGVRVEASAYLQQQIADNLGVSLLPPKVNDLMFAQSSIVIAPITQPLWATQGTMTTTPNMVVQSAMVDRVIEAKAGSLEAAKDVLVQTTGKTWVLVNELLNSDGSIRFAAGTRTPVAANYGFYFTGTLAGVPNDFPVTPNLTKNGKPVRMIQSVGTRHDFKHTDYSQNCLFMLKDVMLDGQQARLEDILSNPQLAPLASHQGVLRVLRQPGVPYVGA